MRRLVSAVQSLILAFVLSPAAQAAGDELDYFSLPPEQLLSAEVISVSKKKERVSDTAAAVYIISQDDIRRAGVTSIPEALRMAPGVQVARADSNSWAISIRGFNGTVSNKLLVMIDGRTVYNPLFAGTYWELQGYPLEDIDRIEVVRGPGGAVWGANAVNGVINIITKSAADTQGVMASALYGREEGKATVRQGGAFEGGHYRLYGQSFNRDSSVAAQGGAAKDDWRGGRAGFRSDWGGERDGGLDGGLTIQGDVYRVLTDQYNRTPAATPITESETMDSRGANILGRYTRSLDNGAQVSVQSYLDYTERDQILLQDRRGIFDIEAQYNFAPIGPHEIVTGVGYRYMRDDLSDTRIIDFTPDERGDSLYSLFLQDKITLLPDKVFLTLGTKLEHNDYTGTEIQPNLRLQYHPDPSQTVWGAVSRAVRTPSRLEHDLSYNLLVVGGTSYRLLANPDFESEELIAYELGYRKKFSKDASFDIAGFYNDYDKLSTYGFLPTTPGVIPFQTVNGMTGETYGFEFAANWNATQDLQFSATYSVIDMKLHVKEANGYDLETAEGTTPHQQAGLRAGWAIREGLRLDTSLYAVDQLVQTNTDGYVRLDMNLEWEIQKGLRFNLTGQNLLESSHREFSAPNALNAAEIERSVFGKVTWEF